MRKNQSKFILSYMRKLIVKDKKIRPQNVCILLINSLKKDKRINRPNTLYKIEFL